MHVVILKNINANHWRERIKSFERLEPLRLCSEKLKDSSPRKREEQFSLNFESRFKVALKAFADWLLCVSTWGRSVEKNNVEELRFCFYGVWCSEKALHHARGQRAGYR